MCSLPLSGCLSGCLAVWLAGWLAVCLSVCLAVCLAGWLAVYLPICLSLSLSLFLSLSLSLFLSLSVFRPSLLLIGFVSWLQLDHHAAHRAWTNLPRSAQAELPFLVLIPPAFIHNSSLPANRALVDAFRATCSLRRACPRCGLPSQSIRKC